MMTTKTILSLALGLFLAACTASTEPGDGVPATQTGAAQAEPPAATDGAEYIYDCHGNVTKKSSGFRANIGPRCVGGAPGTKCGGDPCAPQAIAIHYEPPSNKCVGAERFVWDGTSCKKYWTTNAGQMHCKGADCESMFTSEELCKTAYDACIAK